MPNARKGIIILSMPEIPPQHHRPNICQTTIDLLESIALEEMALSHVLNAEAEKIQYFIGHLSPCTPTEVLSDFNIIINETLETVIMKEWLLLRKLEKVTRFYTKHFSSNCQSFSDCKPNHCDTGSNYCETSCQMYTKKGNCR